MSEREIHAAHREAAEELTTHYERKLRHEQATRTYLAGSVSPPARRTTSEQPDATEATEWEVNGG